jgi:hypothetical protein
MARKLHICGFMTVHKVRWKGITLAQVDDSFFL